MRALLGDIDSENMQLQLVFLPTVTVTLTCNVVNQNSQYVGIVLYPVPSDDPPKPGSAWLVSVPWFLLQ